MKANVSALFKKLTLFFFLPFFLFGCGTEALFMPGGPGFAAITGTAVMTAASMGEGASIGGQSQNFVLDVAFPDDWRTANPANAEQLQARTDFATCKGLATKEAKILADAGVEWGPSYKSSMERCLWGKNYPRYFSAKASPSTPSTVSLR